MRSISPETRFVLLRKRDQWLNEETLPLRNVYRTEFKHAHSAALRGERLASPTMDNSVPW
jgi:hypothetical protein